MKSCYISKESFEKICSQGKQEDMERLIEFQLIEFEKTKKQKGIIKILNEYVEAYNPNIEEEKIDYEGEKSYKDFIYSRGINGKTGKEEFGVDIEKVSRYIEDKLNIRTIYGIKSETIEVYKEGIWTIKGRGIIKFEIESLLKEYSKNNIVNEILEKIKRRTEISREKADEISPTKRAVSNGVLDFENPEEIKLIPHSKEYNFRSKWEINYDKKATCPKIINLFKESFDEEDILKLQEWFGLHLSQRYLFKKFALIHGPRDTGKTIILNLLTIFLNYNVSGLSLQKISRGKDFDLLNLKDKDANICDDLSSLDMKATGGIKMSVGDGFIDGEQKFGDKIKFRNSAKQTFACNKIPNPGEDLDDEAYYSRILLFPMENVIKRENQNKNLINELTTSIELSGLLNWTIEGYKRLMRQNGFSNEKNPEEIKFLMLQNGNSLAEFSSEVLVEHPGGKINKEMLYRVYCKWSLDHKPKLSPDTKEKIGRHLIKFAPYIQSSKSGSERYWLNVKIRDTWDTFKINMSENWSKDIGIDNGIQNIRYVNPRSVPSVPLLPCESCEKPTKNMINGIPICEKCSK